MIFELCKNFLLGFQFFFLFTIHDDMKRKHLLEVETSLEPYNKLFSNRKANVQNQKLKNGVKCCFPFREIIHNKQRETKEKARDNDTLDR